MNDTARDPAHDLACVRRLVAGVLVNAIRSLTRKKRMYEGEPPEAIAEWLYEEREALGAFGVARIPQEHDAFMAWIYGVAEDAKRNHLWNQPEDFGACVKEGIRKHKVSADDD